MAHVPADTRLDVPVHAGAAIAIDCQFPENVEPVTVELEVSDAAGALVAKLSWLPRHDPHAELTLGAGSYRVAGRAPSLAGSAAIQVDGRDPQTAVVSLR